MDAEESETLHEVAYNGMVAFTYTWDTQLVFVPDVDVPHGDLQVVDNFGYQGRN